MHRKLVFRNARRLIGTLVLFGVLAVPRLSWSQGMPQGSEFRVNTYTTSQQRHASVALDSSGNFVVVWGSSLQDGMSGGSIFGQRYDGSGAPLGPEFRVNTYTTNSQTDPSVAARAAGDFVVVWSSLQDGSYYNIFGQRYASSGVPLGSEFRVNADTTLFHSDPRVASDASGTFVVVWNSRAAVGDAWWDVFGQRYATSGAPLGPAFRVNTYTTYDQMDPSVASDPTGNFVVVWWSQQDSPSYGIFGQRYASSGTPLGPEFRVNTYTTARQTVPAVSVDAAGNFVVAWRDDSGISAPGISARRYAAAGTPLGPQFRVNTYTTNFQVRPRVASDASGRFIIVWDKFSPSGSGGEVAGQCYDGSGVPLGAEFVVNSYTTGIQIGYAIAADPSGQFVVIWASDQDDPSFDVFAQRFGEIVPAELTQFTVR